MILGKWQPPPSIWIKVHIDAATSDFLTAVVAKDANGIVIKVWRRKLFEHNVRDPSVVSIITVTL